MRYGCVNEHNGWVPRDFWLEPWEKQAIIEFHLQNPLEGYRRLTFMMLDADVVAVSPASVWRYTRGGGPGPLAFGNARLTDRRAGRRWLFCREECKQRDSNRDKDHNVLGTILPVHPVRHGLRRHDCHREPMGKA